MAVGGGACQTAGTTRRQYGVVVAFLILFVAALIGVRLSYGISWGGLDCTEAVEQIPLGIGHGVLDNLSYVAWAQQAKDGIVPFTVLQTTEPHPAVFVLPVFLLIGKLAGFFGVHPLLLMNWAALSLAALTVFLVYLSAREIGLPARAGVLAMILTAFGSGLSVLLRLLFPEAAWATGADVSYLDIFPSAVFPFFPYQTIGLASAAALLYALLRAEARLMRGGRSGPHLLTIFILALVAIAVRPYVPLSLLAIYAGLVALTWLCRGEPPLRRARLLLLLALLVGIGPLALYYHWVATQPVWAEFAAASLTLSHTRLAWLIGFGVYWPLAAVGATFALKQGRRRADLVSLWAGYVFVLLLVVNSEESKFAEGGLIALALLSALAAERILEAGERRGRGARVLAWQTLLLLLLVASLGTISLYGRGPSADYFTVDREIVLAAQQVRESNAGRVPTVLTEARAGALLPALASLRVYVGHWSLTLDLKEKRAQLRAAGFEPDSPTDDLARRRTAFESLLRAAHFDYVLVRKDRPALPLIAAHDGFAPAYRGKRWLLFRSLPPQAAAPSSATLAMSGLSSPRSTRLTSSTIAALVGVAMPNSAPLRQTKPFRYSISVRRPLAMSCAIEGRCVAARFERVARLSRISSRRSKAPASPPPTSANSSGSM